MVKPVSSKRKLFSLGKNQKENTPAEDKSQLDQSTGNTSTSIRSGNNGAKKAYHENEGLLHTPNRLMPMSERQQIAFVKKITSPSTPKSSDLKYNAKTTPRYQRANRVLRKCNERGETPLHLAAIKGDVEKLCQLIDNGANVSAKDHAGWTPLHEACNKGNREIVDILINAGADINAKGYENLTPLHDACINAHYEIVNLLLRRGADFRAVNRHDQTPRDICQTSTILSLLNQFELSLPADNNRTCSSTPEFEGFNKESVKFSKKYYYNVKEKMSRKTPPAKADGKNSPPCVSSASNSSSSNSTLNMSTASSNSGPDSPRVTLRLPQVPRTPEKSQHKDSKVSENEDVYEFKCTKDNSEESAKEETVSNEAAKQEPETKGEKRPREEVDDEEKKKRRKEEIFSDKTSKGTNGRSSNLVTKNPSSNSGQSTAAAAPQETTVATSDLKPVSTTEKAVSSPSSSSPKFAENVTDAGGEDAAGEAGPGAPKVPPLKIVLSSTGPSSEQEVCSQVGKNGSNRQLPYVVSSSSEEKDNLEVKGEPEATQDEQSATESASSNVVSSSSPNSCAESAATTTSCSTSTTSGVNSSSRISMMPAGSLPSSSSTAASNCMGEKGAARITRSRCGGGNSTEEVLSIKSEPQPEDIMTVTTTDVVPPRKRKLKKVPDVEIPPVIAGAELTVPNCYEMFFKIRRQVERRRKLLVPVQPKPPQGFKDYLMNRCSYALAGNNNAQMTPPVAFPPTALSQPLKDLFTEQEAERHKLRLQHQVEKEKLVLSVEQEIIRVHGRAARALANQVLPFSVCTILKDEEVYNVITPEQEEKDRNARSRYNGRLFLSWLQDVDDKWEKIKEAMVLRHHNEAESLHAVQKMDWEWKLKELSIVEESLRPKIEEAHVPIVPVSDFDLLPDING